MICQWIIVYGMQCWNAIRDTHLSWPNNAKLKDCFVDDTE